MPRRNQRRARRGRQQWLRNKREEELIELERELHREQQHARLRIKPDVDSGEHSSTDSE
jgi:hypothetical protein